jgi:thioredoxin-related protein
MKILLLFLIPLLSFADNKVIFTPSPIEQLKPLTNINNEYNFSNIFIEAKKQNKKVLIMASKEGCPACKYMIDKTLQNDEIKEFINENYLFLKLEKGDITVKEILKPIGFPIFYLFDTNKEIIETMPGSSKPVDFMEFLNTPFN